MRWQTADGRFISIHCEWMLCALLWFWGKDLAPRGSSITRALETQNHNQKSPNAKKNHGMYPKQLTPGIHISLTPTDPCLPSTALQCSDVYYFWSSQRVSLVAFAWLCGSAWNRALKIGFHSGLHRFYALTIAYYASPLACQQIWFNNNQGL